MVVGILVGIGGQIGAVVNLVDGKWTINGVGTVDGTLLFETMTTSG